MVSYRHCADELGAGEVALGHNIELTTESVCVNNIDSTVNVDDLCCHSIIFENLSNFVASLDMSCARLLGLVL